MPSTTQVPALTSGVAVQRAHAGRQGGQVGLQCRRVHRRQPPERQQRLPLHLAALVGPQEGHAGGDGGGQGGAVGHGQARGGAPRGHLDGHLHTWTMEHRMTHQALSVRSLCPTTPRSPSPRLEVCTRLVVPAVAHHRVPERLEQARLLQPPRRVQRQRGQQRRVRAAVGGRGGGGGGRERALAERGAQLVGRRVLAVGAQGGDQGEAVGVVVACREGASAGP